MKAQISGVELYFLVKELQGLVDGKVEKIYNPKKEEVIFTLHLPNIGKKILRIVAGKYMYISESRESAVEPTGFCTYLRKQLSNARIREIIQLESERIVKIVFEKKEGKKNLIVELFGRGNILLTDSNDVILTAVDYHKFKDRTIRPKETYTYPKREINVFSLHIDEMKKAITSTEKDSLATFLAVDLGLGGVFSEELCLRVGFDKKRKPNDLSLKEQHKIVEELFTLLKSKLKPNIITKEGKLKDILPIEMEVYKGLDKEDFGTFSSALDSGISKFLLEKKPTSKELEIKRLQRIIDAQEKKLEEMKKAEVENREKGEKIFENYQVIDSLLKDLNKIEKEHSWQEIKTKLKGHKLIKNVDVKEKKITVDV
ncbi:NFACT family protein [Nanoarchaeota archaeon]